MDEWKPIETAPKDGQFLAFWPSYRERAWLHEHEPLDDYRTIDGQVLAASKDHTGRVYVVGNWAQPGSVPTHWMPLPAPPSP